MSFRAEVGLVLLLGALLVLALVAGGRAGRPAAVDERVSTLVSGPGGARAVYDVLGRLGRPVARRRRPLFDLSEDAVHRPALLVVLSPPQPLEAAELEQVVAFVDGGGALLAAGNGGGITACAGWRARSAGKGFLDSVAAEPPTPGLRLPGVHRVLAPLATTSSEVEKLEVEKHEGVPALPDASFEVTDCGTLQPVRRDTLLRTTDGRPIVLRQHYGNGGQVTLAADPAWFRNRVWRDTDAPYVIAPLFESQSSGHVTWDEYHQGYGESSSLERAIAAWLVRSPAGWALLQLAAVALVTLGVAALRFGPPRPVIERRRRSPLEHLEALAAGLEGAAGADTAVALIAGGLRRRLGRTGHLAPGAAGQWLAALEPVLPTPAGRQAARRLQAIISQPGGAERALAAAQAVEAVWEELRPRTTRD